MNDEIRYLYIFEGGAIGISQTAPTMLDRDSMASGVLEVLRIDGTVSQLDNVGSEVPCDVAVIRDGYHVLEDSQ